MNQMQRIIRSLSLPQIASSTCTGHPESLVILLSEHEQGLPEVTLSYWGGLGPGSHTSDGWPVCLTPPLETLPKQESTHRECGQETGPRRPSVLLLGSSSLPPV